MVNKKPKPPQARKDFHKVTQFGDQRTDPYYWLRGKHPDDWQDLLKDPDALDSEVRAHLSAENNYFESQSQTFQNLSQTLAAEMDARMVPDDEELPTNKGDWQYWKAFRAGGDYPIYKRKNLTTQQEEIIIDGDKEKGTSNFFNLKNVVISPDHKLAAYICDREGAENFEIRIRDLSTGNDLPDIITQASSEVVWSADSSLLYYMENNDNHRAEWVKSHKIGGLQTQDTLLYAEADDMFHLHIKKSQSEKYIFIEASAAHETETLFIDADAPVGATAHVIKPRGDDERYYVEHNDRHFYINTNRDGAHEFKLMRAPVNAFAQDNWVDFGSYDPDITIMDVATYKDYMLRTERKGGLPRIVISDYQNNHKPIYFPDVAYDIELIKGMEYDTDQVRVSYSSLASPEVIYDIELNSAKKAIARKKTLPNGHDPDQYIVEYLHIKARDGAEVPVTILRHKSTKLDGSSPLYQYGYGSYAAQMDGHFRSAAFCSVDRGAIFAIAHVRGGAEKGYNWYEDGKKKNKQNTFTDFIDISEALTDMGYGRKGEVFMEGVSAGGLLVGAVANMRPDLYAGAYAGVPFVDVLNTISDGSLPLTPGEWEEWGNPIVDKAAYDTIKAYSPYDNIQKGAKYPAIFASAGLTDFRVTYWEPAKWIARLRDETKGGPFLLKTDMNAGHGGSMARFGRNQQVAERQAFAVNLFKQLGYDMSLREANISAANSPTKKQGPGAGTP